jgi:hypothetical protein
MSETLLGISYSLDGVHTVIANPELVKNLCGAGAEVYLSTSPQAFLAFSMGEAVQWACVVKHSDAQAYQGSTRSAAGQAPPRVPIAAGSSLVESHRPIVRYLY